MSEEKVHTTSSSSSSTVDEEIANTRVEKKKVLGTVKLTGLLYIAVVGGAYGAEPMVQSIGPWFSILIMILASIFVMLPMGLITAELSIALPSNGGMVEWITSATHPFSNFFTMFITVISLVGATIDNAIYPPLFVSYLEEKTGELPIWGNVLIKFAVTFACCLLNITGVDILGKVSVLFTIVVLLPFFFFVPFGIFDNETNWSNLLAWKPFKEQNWSLLISVLFWNLNGVDGCGNVCEEVKNVKRTVPKAMVSLVVMTACTYILPCLVGVLLDENWADWEEGNFVTISERLTMKKMQTLLPWMMFLGGLISSMGYLLNLLLTASRLFHAFILLDFHPLITKTLGHVNPLFKTPDVSIILQGIIIFVMSCAMDFEELVGVDSAFYAVRVMFIAISFIILRWRYPKLNRPYKFGNNNIVATCLAIPLILFCALCFVLGLLSTALTIIFGGIVMNFMMIFSIIFHWFYKRSFLPHEYIMNYNENTEETLGDTGKIKSNQTEGTMATMELDRALSVSTESNEKGKESDVSEETNKRHKNDRETTEETTIVKEVKESENKKKKHHKKHEKKEEKKEIEMSSEEVKETVQEEEKKESSSSSEEEVKEEKKEEVKEKTSSEEEEKKEEVKEEKKSKTSSSDSTSEEKKSSTSSNE